MIKGLAAILFLMSTIATTTAQDRLFKIDGEVVRVKVLEVRNDVILYKNHFSQSGDTLKIQKNEIIKIELENGVIFYSNDETSKAILNRNGTSNKKLFRRNIISFSPLKAFDSGPGIGLSYEKLVDRTGNIGIILPASIAFVKTYQNSPSGNYTGSVVYYLAPGMKIYPFGHKRTTYAIGSNVFAGFSTTVDQQSYVDQTTGQVVFVGNRTNNFKLGVIVNNYVNFRLTDSFLIGMNLGIGIRYLDKKRFDPSNYYNSSQIMGEFNLNLGFPF